MNDGGFGMEPRNVATWWMGVGSLLIGSAIVNTLINLDSVPSLWSGPIYVILLIGFLGVVLVVYGFILYRRISRPKSGD